MTEQEAKQLVEPAIWCVKSALFLAARSRKLPKDLPGAVLCYLKLFQKGLIFETPEQVDDVTVGILALLVHSPTSCLMEEDRCEALMLLIKERTLDGLNVSSLLLAFCAAHCTKARIQVAIEAIKRGLIEEATTLAGIYFRTVLYDQPSLLSIPSFIAALVQYCLTLENEILWKPMLHVLDEASKRMTTEQSVLLIKNISSVSFAIREKNKMIILLSMAKKDANERLRLLTAAIFLNPSLASNCELVCVYCELLGQCNETTVNECIETLSKGTGLDTLLANVLINCGIAGRTFNAEQLVAIIS